jgi:hypothetical protein
MPEQRKEGRSRRILFLFAALALLALSPAGARVLTYTVGNSPGSI